MRKKKKLPVNLEKDDVIKELNRIKYNSKFNSFLRNTCYSLLIIAAVAVIIASLFLPVFQITTSSMEPTFSSGDIVVSVRTTKLQQGDLIAFYHGNKILIKRVIATQGQKVSIDKKGNVTVDGKVLEEDYVLNKTLGDNDVKYPYQVPAESYFVLSDNREETIDSRNNNVGSIAKDDIIGKALFKVWPLK